MNDSSLAEKDLLSHLLKKVSRSFYLTLRILPGETRVVISIAYLLARAADTISDTKLLAGDLRAESLAQLKNAIVSNNLDSMQKLTAGLAVNNDTHNAESELLAALPAIMGLFQSITERDRQKIVNVVSTLISGMEFDLTHFAAASDEVIALTDTAQLDFYTYAVAGCVGEFWTSVIADHVPALTHWDQAHYTALGIRFGQALQLTNILRDIAGDLAIGRCYIPRDALDQARLSPQDLQKPESQRLLRPVLDALVRQALTNYLAAEAYITGIPTRCLRLRLAALWPTLIGLATLEKLLRDKHWPGGAQPVKVSRRWIYGMLLLSCFCGFSNALTRRWIRHLFRNVETALRASQGQ